MWCRVGFLVVLLCFSSSGHGIDYPPLTNLPSEPEEAPAPMIFPSHEYHQNVRGPVISPSVPVISPSVSTPIASGCKPSIPYPALARNISKRQAPVPLAPQNEVVGYPSQTNLPSQPQEVPPPMIFPLYGHHENLQGPVASPSVPATRPALERPTKPYPALPRNRLKIRVPVPVAPQNQDIGYPSPTNLPAEPWEAPPPMIFPSHGHYQKLQGPVFSPTIPATRPAQEKQTIPYSGLPMNRSRSKRQAPVPLAPRNQVVDHPSPTNLPSQPQEVPPPMIFPLFGHHANLQGPVASPTVPATRPALEKPTVPYPALPRDRLKIQAPVTVAPQNQDIGYPPPTNLPSEPWEAPPPMIFPSHGNHQNLQGPVISPKIPATRPAQEKPTKPFPALPMNRSRSKRQALVPLAPRNQGIDYPPPTNLPYEPQEAPAPMIFPSHGHHQNRQEPVVSPRVSTPIPAGSKPSIPYPALPKNRSKRQAPVPLAPHNEVVDYPSPTNLPSQPQEVPPPMIFPSYGHHEKLQGPVASPSVPATRPALEKQTVPYPALPRNRLKIRAPVPVAPQNQGPVISPSIPAIRPAQGKPTIPYPALPMNRSRSKRLAPRNQGIDYPPPANLPSEPEAAPAPMILSSHGHHQHMQGPVVSPSVSTPIPAGSKPSIPYPALPRHRSKRQAPVPMAPQNEDISYPPPTNLPSEPWEAPSAMIFPSHGHHQSMQGPVTSPSIPATRPAQEKPTIPYPTLPLNRSRSKRQAPVPLAPRIQGIGYFPPTNLPSQPQEAPPPIVFPYHGYHQNVQGPVSASPSAFPASPAREKPAIPRMEFPRNRSKRQAHLSLAPSSQGIGYPSPTNIPFQSQGMPPRTEYPSHGHHQRVQGHVTSPSTDIYRPSPKKRTALVAPSPITSSHWHSPTAIVPTGPFNSHPSSLSPEQHRQSTGPMPSPLSNASQPPQTIQRISPVAPQSKRPRRHTPVALTPIHQGNVPSRFSVPSGSPKVNSEIHTFAPSSILPSPHDYSGVKGPFSPLPNMIPSQAPQRKPDIPIAAPPSKRLWKHVPVASPSRAEGPLYSPANSPHPSPSKNSRIPPVSSPVTSPPHDRLRNHAPVASQPTIQGPVYSLSPSSSGNLRSPTVSPPIIYPSPPHHHPWSKHGPVAISPMSQGNLRVPAASPSNKFPLPSHLGHTKGPVATPINPPEAPENAPVISVASPPLIFPPPPPRQDCSLMTCTEPYTSTPPGSPCGCVYPMQVALGLGVALYEFFPLVSELAKEIAAGTFLKQSQVRIMGANADSQDQENTIVNVDLVPLGVNFDNTTAFLIFERFWQKKVLINETLFDNYWVIYVQYPGLPPSPPSPFSNGTHNGMPDLINNGPSKIDPLGVDIDKRSDKMGAATIAVVALSSAIAVIICLGTVWIILLKCRNQNRPTSAVPEPTHVSSVTKRSVGGSILSGSIASSTSMSFASSMATYTGSAKTFTSAELEKATDRFNPQKFLGEGGFGRVYRGVLEDGTKVAVKVLTRDDQQGGREFIAEVEMLSRLHHRNLVKLIGICAEEHNRCLVYELIPNGSVESHLHGLDKETTPLDWDARIKIALGAARGLAYLHEDSSPRVIHRDFKASNILLEDDFTPKVSDFGLAKSASEEVSGHISTRVMGTFGYVAPEYAMTGHLKVKSDVYSYGVVLLELLSGRKPVDMSQPSGQENLVTWARPLLTSKEGLETLIDPALGRNLPFDNVAKVAAIASMCVQPEHSHRPFMGEVVQALKLVYNDSDASNGGGSGSFSRGESSVHDIEAKDISGQPWPQSRHYVPENTSFVTIDYDSGPLETEGLEVERPISASALMSTSGRFIRQLSGSFRRHSSSGPLRTNKSKLKDPCYGIRGLAGGSISEHGVNRQFGRHLDGNEHELWP